MVFHADTAFALILIALGVGFWVLVKARTLEAGNLKGFGTILGYFIVVLSFLVLLCAGYYSVRYWADGYFTKPATMGAMMGSMSMHGGTAGMMKGPGCGKEMKGHMMPDDTGKTMDEHMQGMMHEGHKIEDERQPE